MKKRFWFLAAVGILVVALAAPAAFGAITGGGQNDQNGQTPQNQAFFDQMFVWHQKWLDPAQKDGQISSEQATAWQEHFNYMRDFHNKNGFGPMGSMMGGNGNGMMGPGGGMMGNYNGTGGYGGMMGGGFNNSQTGPAQTN